MRNWIRFQGSNRWSSKLVKAGIQAALAKKVASAAKKLDKASTATKKTAAAAKGAKAAPAKAKAAAKKAPKLKAKATASKAAATGYLKKTTDKAKNLVPRQKPKPNPNRFCKKRRQILRDAFVKNVWFRNAKK